MKLFSTTVLVVACVLVSGCGMYKVTRGGVDVGGVPFLTRQPVTYQVTRLVQTRLKVQYVMKVGGTVHRAPEIPVEILGGRLAETEIASINRSLQNARPGSPAEFRKVVDGLIQSSSTRWHACGSAGEGGMFCAYPDASNSLLVSNRLEVRTEISDAQHYINVRRPWVGKTTAAVEISSDGTLAKSTAEVESKTLETVASIIPFTGYANKVLELGEYWAGKAGTTSIEKGHSFGLIMRPQSETASFSVEVASEPWFYVLQEKRDGLGEPLAYSVAGTAQLVEAGRVGLPAKKAEAGDKGWTITGALTPPVSNKE